MDGDKECRQDDYQDDRSSYSWIELERKMIQKFEKDETCEK